MNFIRRNIRYPLNLLFVIKVWLDYYLISMFGPFLGHTFYEGKLKKLHSHYAKKYFERAIKYKGLLIKFGQVISCRPDIMPKEYITELSKLQDRIPPTEFSEIKLRIETELNGPIEDLFDDFDENPIASASLGQVHSARLKTGEKVAIKVQYPGIDSVVSSDLKILWIALKLFSLFRKMDIKILFDEIRRVLTGELNYVREARYAEKFRSLFEKDNNVVSPLIYSDYSTTTVLTMEYVSGVKISDFAANEKDKERKKRVLERLVEVYSAQFFKHGFFHADPHPGNIFISDNDEIVFVDFGICSELDDRTRQGLRKIVRATIEYDVELMIEASKELGIITANNDVKRTRELLLFAVNEYKDVSPKEFKNSELVSQWVDSVQEYLQKAKSFQIPHKILLFLRTLSILEGHLAVLDPDLNLVQIAKPFVIKYVIDDVPVAKMILDGILDFVKTAARVPRELERFLQKTNEGQTFIRTEDVSLSKLVALLPSIFFGVLTILFVAGIPVMDYFEKTTLTASFVILAPVSLGLTIWTYKRAVQK